MPGTLQQGLVSSEGPDTTIHRGARRYSSRVCLIRCRGLPCWPPCAGGPAGETGQPPAGYRVPLSQSALGGEGGWSTSSTIRRRAPWLEELGKSIKGVHHALDALPPGRRQGRVLLAYHPGQTLPGPPPDLGSEPPPVPQDRLDRGGAGPSSQDVEGELWLVISRPGKGRKPW